MCIDTRSVSDVLSVTESRETSNAYWYKIEDPAEFKSPQPVLIIKQFNMNTVDLKQSAGHFTDDIATKAKSISNLSLLQSK